MASEIRVNKINNRAGLGTVTYTDTGIIVSGIVTANSFKGDGDFFDLDVDGHTNLDNVNIAGVTTFANNVKINSGKQLQFGSSNVTIMLSSNDLQLATHSSSDIVLKSNSGGGNAGNIYFRTVTGGKVFLTGTGGVGIYHDDSSLKIETTNTGAVVTGVLTATSFSGDGSSLSNLPAGAPVGGASTNTVFFENDKEVAVNYQITSTKNAMSAGPIAINAGIAVTVPSGCSWTII